MKILEVKKVIWLLCDQLLKYTSHYIYRSLDRVVLVAKINECNSDIVARTLSPQ
jgi:hypothetical protein